MAAEFILEEIPGQVGTLVLDHNGSILQSSGDLDGNQQAAGSVLRMLQNTNSLATDGKFRRMTVNCTNGTSYVITMTNGKIFTVKRK
mmetsp:Transcript_38415/g.53492  ORF Transcript_38415/g.53492 Transcript_38415/m.53492 type:complete len:87 (+) Transcript_38415:214-474(+)|eukprot:CAMPEP_0201490418 /NCGR_PEP_ID=MMETSP0151_2-20130828/26543_1 /ASSEMBLY_ACC=CAM_ASM_000257 /TAXON_ID=200890 /ORGANISM="Paramoeba atlantica, Strain 621/1 / CCAP 1560/9" /LENGTH=86 /DNA_ID=CAMNT_0047876381 /DNA_START=31 /DNA_END=291 /DNA_ORIENTATION=+